MQYDINELHPMHPWLVVDMFADINLGAIDPVLEPNASKEDIIKHLLRHMDKYNRKTADSQYFLVSDSPGLLLPLCG